MEKQMIVAEMVQSNKSENQVWHVHVTGTDNPELQGFCKNAYKAMRLAFILKQRAQCSIAEESLQQLMLVHALTKETAEATTEAEPALEPVDSVTVPEGSPEGSPKQRRTKRTKKEKAAA